MPDFNATTRRTASEEEQRIKAIVQRELRETFKNGLPSGRYSTYLWDGMKIVGGGQGGLSIDAIYTMSVTNTVLGDTTPKRLNFNHQIYDPLSQVTTGASWAFTAAAAAVYVAWVNAPLSISGTPWVSADRADLTLQGAVNVSIATWAGIAVAASPANLLLGGWRGVALSQGDTIYAQLVQDSGTSFDVDEAIANIIVGHV